MPYTRGETAVRWGLRLACVIGIAQNLSLHITFGVVTFAVAFVVSFFPR